MAETPYHDCKHSLRDALQCIAHHKTTLTAYCITIPLCSRRCTRLCKSVHPWGRVSEIQCWLICQGSTAWTCQDIYIYMYACHTYSRDNTNTFHYTLHATSQVARHNCASALLILADGTSLDWWIQIYAYVPKMHWLAQYIEAHVPNVGILQHGCMHTWCTKPWWWNVLPQLWIFICSSNDKHTMPGHWCSAKKSKRYVGEQDGPRQGRFSNQRRVVCSFMMLLQTTRIMSADRCLTVFTSLRQRLDFVHSSVRVRNN